MKKIFERPIIKKLNTGMPSKFGMKTEYEPMTHIDQVPVKELLEDFGSPLYVVSEKTIREVYREAHQAFATRYPKIQFAWSYKTNYMDAVCKVYHQEGSWAEVVSGFEYDKAIRNGIQPEQIIFNGPDKSEEDLTKAIKNQSLIHIDHFDELYTIIGLCDTLKERPQVAIRVNMDTGIQPHWTRFGFNYENGEAWDAINRIMISDKMDLIGLHAHIGTYIMTANAYNVAGSKLSALAVSLKKKYQKVISYIDFGGGFASKNTLKGAYLPGTDTTPSFDEYADAITSSIINSEIAPEDLPTIVLETGRALIDDAGYLLGTVLANKRLADNTKTLVIDAGVNMLFTSFWYDHKITPAQPFSHHTESAKIYGPLCMNIDVIREQVDLPPLKKGDHFVISRIGAYNMTQWMQFITYRPKIVMIDEQHKPHIIRNNENLETITQLEKVPEHLK
jgi:diaminopimelate decarboxylase